MKKSAKLKRKTIKLIVKNLIVFSVLAVVAFVGVFSWFTNKSSAEADRLSVRTQIADGLEYFIVAPNSSDQYSAINTWISNYNTNHSSETGFVAKDWHTGTLNFDFSDAELKFMEDLFLCETTSDGYTFKIPSLIQYGEIAYVDTTVNFEDATPNNEYMSFDLYFRSKSSFDVVLKSGSSISPVGTIDTSTDEGMQPAAIGAVRMSVYNGNTRELIWIPGPNLWYNGTYNNGEGLLLTNQTTYPTNRGNVYYNGSGYALYSERTIDHAYYNASKTRTILQNNPLNNNSEKIIASTAGDYQLGEDISIVTLDQNGGDGYYYNHVRVNLWIEGEDAESRLKFVGGDFDLSLLFDKSDSGS